MSAPIRSDTIPPGGHWSGIVENGQVLRITDLEGRQGVDFLCYNADCTGFKFQNGLFAEAAYCKA